ncbi:MAG: ABC transporter permease [Christensenellales bacterium]|jgi:ribose transport system permease protein
METKQINPALSDKKLNWGYRIFLTPEVGVLIPILILSAVTAWINPSFLTWRYIASILTGSIFIGAAALGEGLVIMSGEIDLSVGMNGCFAGIMCGVAAADWGLGLIPCLLIGLGAGALVGLVNGLMVCKLGLTSWITTLATQFICQGLAVTISQGVPISISSLGTSTFTRARPLGLNWLFFIFIVLIIVVDFLIRRTSFGYKLRAVGGNSDAARTAGINVDGVKIAVFVIAGALAAVGGLFDVLNNATANSNFGAGREFRAIICCAIGGVSMSGGSGSAYGIGLGVMLFHTLWYCLRILSVDTNLQLVLIGFILVLAVLLDIQRKRVEARKMV